MERVCKIDYRDFFEEVNQPPPEIEHGSPASRCGNVANLSRVLHGIQTWCTATSRV